MQFDEGKLYRTAQETLKALRAFAVSCMPSWLLWLESCSKFYFIKLLNQAPIAKGR